MRKPTKHLNKQLNILCILITLVVASLVLLSCEKEQQYICSDVFTPEEVLIEGEPFTIYHKELVCEEIY